MNGPLDKLSTRLADPVDYALVLGDTQVPLNARIGGPISLHFGGSIRCDNCGKRTRKSYAQGHCFVCMRKLASCDMCILKPETCHFHLGTCREPDWGEANCFAPHIVYLANTAGPKVGITRESQVPTRWMDQGASQAMPLLRVATRFIAGQVEVALAAHIPDKTNWRALLKGPPEPVDLPALSATLLPEVAATLDQLRAEHGEAAIEVLAPEPITINYPVEQYPQTIKSHNFDKTDSVSGTLTGIKGQYLLLDTGVLNARKFTAYDIALD